MLWTLRALLLVVLGSVCAQAQTRTLALYTGPANGLDVRASEVMREELQRLLRPAEIDVVWKSLSDRRSAETFELVAVSSFEGSCSRHDAPTAPPISASLADTSISDGHILPFFRVDCTHLLRTLGSQTEPSGLGRALARVIGHEIYHIVAKTTEHQETGLAKAVFSVRDLTSNRFDLDAWSLDRMRPPVVARRAADLSAVGAR